MDSRIIYLFIRYLNNECSDDERAEVRAILQEGKYVEEWDFALLEEAANQVESPKESVISETEAGLLYDKIAERIGAHESRVVSMQPVRKRLWPRIAVAASIILAVSAGGYFLMRQPQPQQQVVQSQPAPIKPGGNKAILTLSNGRQVVLTGAQNGAIARQGNITVSKTDDGRIAYQNNETAGPGAAVQYNTMTTPRGGRYEATLVDGTHFILDAGSSIRYPVAFTGKDRVVEIKGQVYFDVKHDPAHPFNVKAKGQVIEDIGTSFNINAYDDEPVIRTTLVEGVIRVSSDGGHATLKPGQQAITQTGSDQISVKDANIADVIAWKNGQTSFRGENIQEIMRQVARWYDVDIVYEGSPPTSRHFNGGITRNAELTDLLKIMEFNNIHFKVEGRKIIVKPN